MTLMSVDQWGRSGWVFIHACSYAYPDAPSSEQKRYMLEFLRSLGHVLPCQRCCAHYTEFMDPRLEAGIASDILASKRALTRALFELHNEVNRRSGKPLATYDEVCALYASPLTGKCGAVPAGAGTAGAGGSPATAALRRNAWAAAAYFVVSGVLALLLLAAAARLTRCRRLGQRRD